MRRSFTFGQKYPQNVEKIKEMDNWMTFSRQCKNVIRDTLSWFSFDEDPLVLSTVLFVHSSETAFPRDLCAVRTSRRTVRHGYGQDSKIHILEG